MSVATELCHKLYYIVSNPLSNSFTKQSCRHVKYYSSKGDAHELTAVARRLQTVFGQSTPADRENVPGVVLAPVVKGSSPAVEHHKDLITFHLSNGGGADQVRILSVNGFQFHARTEVILRRLWRFLCRGTNWTVSVWHSNKYLNLHNIIRLQLHI